MHPFLKRIFGEALIDFRQLKGSVMVSFDQKYGFRIHNVAISNDEIRFYCDEYVCNEIYRLQNILIDKGIEPPNRIYDHYNSLNDKLFIIPSDPYFWMYGEKISFKVLSAAINHNSDDTINISLGYLTMRLTDDELLYNFYFTTPVPLYQIQRTDFYFYFNLIEVEMRIHSIDYDSKTIITRKKERYNLVEKLTPIMKPKLKVGQKIKAFCTGNYIFGLTF